ncbi:O-linked N-acetylglucosamine transferase, SPINDLY family protein [Ferdinandcohnia sp. Marseille-Q9671]
MYTSKELLNNYKLALTYKNSNVQKAIEILENIIKYNKNYNEIHIIYNELGTIFALLNKIKDAKLNFIKAIEIRPNYADGYNNLGTLCSMEKDIDSAINYYIQALEFNPKHKDATENIIKMYLLKQKYGDIFQFCNQLLKKEPKSILALYGNALAYYHLGEYYEAEKYFNEVLKIDPKNINSCMFIGDIYNKRGEFSKAAYLFKKAIEISPKDYRPYNDLGNLYKSIGSFDIAAEYYKTGINLANDNDVKAFIYSNYLLMLNYTNLKEEILKEEHFKFNDIYGVKENISSGQSESITNINRRLKVGYISADFREHSVAYFIYGPFALHNKEQFELFCYSDVKKPDYITERFQSYSSTFVDISGKTNDEVTEIIKRDDIDILVDLSGHTGNNRLPVFAKKPAKIQVSWIGYPNTTGLKTMDYRLVDEYTDPFENENYSEKLIRMPKSFLCYVPLESSPTNLLNHNRDIIRFASFNNYSKVTDEIILNWIKILERVPDSKLLLKDKIFGDQKIVKGVLVRFEKLGMDLRRLEIIPWTNSSTSHLDIYNEVDIGLDTYPYNGTTTTCEAMFMGVPVITLAGEKHSSRVGLSLLSNVGLDNLISYSSEDYIETSVNLALNSEKLKSIKRSLRSQMQKSPLMNASNFVPKLEQIYKFIYYKYCLTQHNVQLKEESLYLYILRLNNLLINNLNDIVEDLSKNLEKDFTGLKYQLSIIVEGIILLQEKVEGNFDVNENIKLLFENIFKSLQLLIKLYSMNNFEIVLRTIQTVLQPAIMNLREEVIYHGRYNICNK